MRNKEIWLSLLLLPIVFSCSRETVVVTEKEEVVVETSSPVSVTPSYGSAPVRVGIIGDSISTFYGWIPEGYVAYYPHTATTGSITEVSQTWWYRLVYTLMPDAVLDRNLSYSATCVAKTGTESQYDRNDFVTRVDEYGFDNPDIVIIHGGTNDRRVSLGEAAPLGNYDFDIPAEELDRYSFRPAYICLVKKILGKWPGVRIVCVIGDSLNQDPYKDLGDSIRTIAEHYGFPVVSFPELLETFDGLHPNLYGAEYIADKMFRTLEEENLLYFKRQEAE